jgi:hypothetical protein
MSSTQARRILRIDVFEQQNQRAAALLTLTPPALVAAIVQEFREIEYLSDNPANYRLRKLNEQTPLPDDLTVAQLAQEERLTLVETELPVPNGAQRPSRALYLREVQSGKVYKLHWSPAIIGRMDSNRARNDRLAVNLETYPNGLGVSRRHACVVEEGGHYFVSSLSPRNPTYHLDAAGQRTLLTEAKYPLQPGDSLFLEGSELTLKFLVRD